MAQNIFHLAALNALVDVATKPRRFENRSQVAVAAGIHESTLSLICAGKRGASEQTLVALASALGVPTDALRVPAKDDDGLVEAVARLESEIAGAVEMVGRLKKEHARLRKQAERAANTE